MTTPVSRHIDRRRFLALLSSSLAGTTFGLSLSGCTHKKLLNPDEDIFISGGSYKEYDKRHHALIIINAIQKEKRVIQCDFVPHECIIHPGDKYTIYCFEKDGPNACAINLQTLSIIEKFQCSGNHVFSGHAVFSKDRQHLYTIESEQQTGQGKISIRDVKTFETIKQLPTLGLNPHDCQLIDEHTLVISNTGRDPSNFHQPSLVTIDMKTEKLVSRVKLDNPRLNAGHFQALGKDMLVIASAPVKTAGIPGEENGLGGVSIKTAETPVTTMTEPEAVIQRMTGEALGIEISQKNDVIAITHPDANLLTFWSLKGKAIIKAIGMESPRGLTQTLDGKHFVISYGTKPAIAQIKISDLSPLPGSILQPTFTSGEHLLNWSQRIRSIMPKRIYD